MLVTIVAIANADNTGLDLDRLEKVEDLPDDVARQMLWVGTAREPSDEELDAYEKAQAENGVRPSDPEGALRETREQAAAQARESAANVAQAEKAVRASRPTRKTEEPAAPSTSDAEPALVEQAAAAAPSDETA